MMNFGNTIKTLRQKPNVQNVVLSFVILIVGFVVSYFIKDMRLAVIFAIVWFDRLVLGYFGLLAQFGLEFSTLATILAALIYGPYFSAVYFAIIGTLMTGFNWQITKSAEPNWPPFLPGPDQIVDALCALIAGMMRLMPIMSAIAIGSVAKFFLMIGKDKIIFYDKPPEIGRITNILFNLLIAIEFQEHIMRLIY